MGNTPFAPHRNGERIRNHPFGNVTRTLWRMLQRRRARAEPWPERSEEYLAFERLLREDFSIYTTSDSDIAEHLITIHVSYTQDQQECNIYISAFNNSGDKIAEATIIEDLTRHSGTQCFLTFMPPNAERVYNSRFVCPYSARFIRAFILSISRPAEEMA